MIEAEGFAGALCGIRAEAAGGDRTGGPANPRTGSPEKAGADLGLAADRVCFAGFSSLCCRFGLPMGQSGVRACGVRRHADGVEAVIRRYPKAGTFGVQTRIPKRNTTMKNP